MKLLLNYLIVDKADDYDKEKIIWDKPDSTRIQGIGVIHHEGDKTNFPQYYKYVEPWDSHCCGDYWSCTKQEIEKATEEKIEQLRNFLENMDK